ncbi:hypothetical protein QWZ10_25665 [Paracoccus cavernae]|uniref:Uncharacterized protein n=1 Tax=Paracoccus cavernae TaxID=1571207 RepID=A0ABT8DCF3_9RHOB|nr:hypothetical protein [Paracoccus cavernae]
MKTITAAATAGGDQRPDHVAHPAQKARACGLRGLFQRAVDLGIARQNRTQRERENPAT